MDRICIVNIYICIYYRRADDDFSWPRIKPILLLHPPAWLFSILRCMFAFLDGVESRRGGGISRNGNPIGKAWHCTQAGSGDVFPTGTHVNAPSLVSCLPARLIFEHASFDAYLPSPSLASAREARNIRLRFHRPQPRTFSNGKSKYPYLLTSLDFLALLGEGKEKKGTPAFAP